MEVGNVPINPRKFRPCINKALVNFLEDLIIDLGLEIISKIKALITQLLKDKTLLQPKLTLNSSLESLRNSKLELRRDSMILGKGSIFFLE